MKKLLIILFCLCSLSGKAQTLQGQLLAGKTLKATAELTYNTGNLFSYSYIETSEAYYWFLQIIDVSFYKRWSAHFEYRTGDSLTAGISRSFGKNGWFASLSGLVRAERDLITGQIGAFWEYNKKRINLYGYAYTWYDNIPRMYLEQRLYYEVAKGFSVGGVVNVSKGEKWEVMPYLGISVKFN